MVAPRTFLGRLYESFIRVNGPFISIIGLILLFVGYFYVPESATLPLRWFLLISVVLLFVIFVVVHAAYTAHNEDRSFLPAARYASEPKQPFTTGVAFLLLDPSTAFSYDTVVAIYQHADEIERLLGLGRVVNVQTDGKIQVLVTHDLGNDVDWKDLCRNDAKLLKQLLVKPTVPSFAMEEISSG